MAGVQTVTQVNRYIKNLFLGDLKMQRISVEGEISNCKYHSSGHIYFTLKDPTSQISCVMFATAAKGLTFHLKEGQSVVVHGSIGVYERDGKYQLYASRVTRQGAGQLYEEYERLKKRLYAEGIFDQDKKKKIPHFALKIGVVTAQTGAVIQDICNIAKRRNPYVQIVLYPAKVQGEGAVYTIIEGLNYFEKSDVDVVIIGRGGGSIEDLWAFNEEELAYAVAACKKPIVSAVGHETDTTISDYVADMRAPTPSAAAELTVFSLEDFAGSMAEKKDTLNRLMEAKIGQKRKQAQTYRLTLARYTPKDQISQRRLMLADAQNRLENSMEGKITKLRHRLALSAQKLEGLSPVGKLGCGYAYLSDEGGNNIRSVSFLTTGQSVKLTLADGTAGAKITAVKKNEPGNGEKGEQINGKKDDA